MTRPNMEKEIIEAMSYKSEQGIGGVYVGSLAASKVMAYLGGAMGVGYEIRRALSQATYMQVYAAWKYLKSFRKYMKKHPTKKCPHCGQIMPA